MPRDPNRQVVFRKLTPITHVDTSVLEGAIAAIHANDTLEVHVEAMRADAPRTVAAAAALLDAHRDEPLHAWHVLYALDQARVPESVELLTREALREIPESGGGCESEADLHELVAIQASEALGRLGEVDALVDVAANQRSRAVRIAAARAAVAAAPHATDRLDAALGADAEALRWPVRAVEHVAVEVTGGVMKKEAPVDAPRLDERGMGIAVESRVAVDPERLRTRPVIDSEANRPHLTKLTDLPHLPHLPRVEGEK